MIFDILQLIGGLILCFGYLPQIKQILKTKSVEDLNFKSFAMIFTGVLFMQIYAINLVWGGQGLMLLITNSMRVIVSGIVCFLIIKYKESKL
jgi:MtN3 and saliva related transmembrane protein